MKLLDISGLVTEVEIGVWQANCDTVTSQIRMREEYSVDRILEGDEFCEMLESVAERIIRKSDIFRSSAVSAHCEDSLKNLIAAFKNILEKIMEAKIDTTINVGPMFWFNSITSFIDFDENFAQQLLKYAISQGLLENIFILDYFKEKEMELEEMIEMCKDFKDIFNNSNSDEEKRDAAGDIVEFLICVGSIFSDIELIAKFFKKHSIKMNLNFIQRCPTLFMKILEHFEYVTLFEISYSLNGFPLRKVFQARSFAVQSLCRCFSEHSTKLEDLPKLFISHCLDLKCGVESKLPSKLIEESRRVGQDHTIGRLKDCGYFKMLGNPKNEMVSLQIKGICEIFPQYSKEMVHLVLRHYSYNFDEALASLFSIDKLPLELTRLKDLDLAKYADDDALATLPVLDFTAADEIEKAYIEEKKADVEKRQQLAQSSSKVSLFSLAIGSTASSQPPKEAVDEKTEIRKKADEYKKKVMATLEAMRTKSVETEEIKLVPMDTSKKFSALNSLKLTEADKVAIRPSYDKYKYETPNDDGMYDDEYDDENEIREFNVERLNEEIETSDDDDVTGGSKDEVPQHQPQASAPTRGRGGGGGYRGRGRGRGAPPAEGAPRNNSSYTGGRERQQKERHKSDHKQRGADRKQRGHF
ncbi:unnamed protein product [Caenorhabditis bovis]|uniref:CUE domain-containing protein n=1 Tax=Caenorhabditis bovis TaxID=2654633 RepID=A0A8S1EN65_9PELO|nr:unnamed protein product [Caenorhabditis bovis]